MRLINFFDSYSRLNRRDFFFYLILTTLIYTASTYFILYGQLFDFEIMVRLVTRSIYEFLLTVIVFFLSASRLKDVGASKFWATIFFMPWVFDFRNMILFSHYFYDSQDISSSTTYLSFFVTSVAFILLSA